MKLDEEMSRTRRQINAYLMDPCDIRHVGIRNNTIHLLWEMKSIVMQKIHRFVFQHGLCRRGLLERQNNPYTKILSVQGKKRFFTGPGHAAKPCWLASHPAHHGKQRRLTKTQDLANILHYQYSILVCLTFAFETCRTEMLVGSFLACYFIFYSRGK